MNCDHRSYYVAMGRKHCMTCGLELPSPTFTPVDTRPVAPVISLEEYRRRRRPPGDGRSAV